jgi:hypothetical protein
LPAGVEAGTEPDARGVGLVESQDVDDGMTVLCVHNLSRFAQPGLLSLMSWDGATPVELLGRVPFPVVTEAPYSLTLPGYGIYWFELRTR